ncbi:MAG: hypothetical protein GY811_14450 [Myxococcales bacterium]|nr:hypothetical protein [Myxococcales bacterium]
MESWLWSTLWRWACRRHSTKSRRWIKRRYFHQVEERLELCAGKLARTVLRGPEGGNASRLADVRPMTRIADCFQRPR